MTQPAPPPPIPPRADLPAPRWDLWLLALALGVALLDLGTRTLHELDTPRWGLLAREMLRTGEWLVPTRYGDIYANKPPLYLWCVAGLGHLTGALTPFWVRLPAALGYVLLVVSSAWWASWRLRDPRGARLVGLVLLSTFGLMWLAREGRLDMFGAGLAVAGTVALDRAAATGSRRAAIWAGVMLGLTALVKGPPHWIPAVAVLLFGGPDALRTRWVRLRARWVLGFALVLPALWLIPAALQGGEAYWRALVVDQMGDRIAGAGNHKEAVWHYLTVGTVHFAPWGPLLWLIALAGLVAPLRRRLPEAAGLAAAGGVVLLLFSLIPTKHVRYMAPVLPFLALPLVGCLLAWLRSSPRGRWRLHQRAAAGALIALAGGIVALGQRAATGHPLPWIVLAVTSLGAGLLGLRNSGDDARAARVRWLHTTLLLTVLAVLTVGVFRYRLRVRDNERFNRAIATRIDTGETFFALAPNTPEDVFHGAPQATLARSVEAISRDTPRPFCVLFRPVHAQALLARFGQGQNVVTPADGPRYYVMRYTSPDVR